MRNAAPAAMPPPTEGEARARAALPLALCGRPAWAAEIGFVGNRVPARPLAFEGRLTLNT